MYDVKEGALSLGSGSLLDSVLNKIRAIMPIYSANSDRLG